MTNKNLLAVGVKVIVKVPMNDTSEQLRGSITAINETAVTVTEDVVEGTPRQVEIPVKNASDILAFVSNPNTPSAQVRNAQLEVDGRVIDTDFSVHDILATLPNKVYIQTDDGTVYSYDNAKDEFYRVLNPEGKAGDILVTPLGEDYLLTYYRTEDKTRIVNKEEQTYKSLCSAGYILINGETGMARCTTLSLPEEIVKVIPGSDNSFAIISRQGFDFDTTKDDDGDSAYSAIIPATDCRLRVYSVKNRTLTNIASADMDGTFETASLCGRTLVLKTDSAINAGERYINKPQIVSALKGYDYLIKDVFKDGVCILTFSTSDFKLKEVKIRHTCDRGDIYSVEDI